MALCNFTVNPFALDPGFNIALVTSVAIDLAVHSWEVGTLSQALLELYDPQYSVFGSSPFPVPSVSPECVPSLSYAVERIVLGSGPNGFADAEGALADPASLGVSAVLLGKHDARYADAVLSEIDYITTAAPRFSNDAISHRVSVAELWADFIYMVPPFLAYAAADLDDTDLLFEAYRQCGLYREILRPPTGPGVWQHIIGPEHQDVWPWSTGNAWAAAGMVRVLATISKSPRVNWTQDAIENLSVWILEIIDGAMSFTKEEGLVRNYLEDGFGEVAGSCLFAAAIYRMAVLQPEVPRNGEHIIWADAIRATMALHITSGGIATPAVNPMNPTDPKPLFTGSPEGNSFVVLMYAAWRDCVLVGICS
ncbi:hypothetical protein MIND_00727300 [Mycena indigotica]|uniref:Six-hairpin glycosidase-like protein n=1 Tax=Mycena indigotica TaxID=2126181 RepID=A0A8H6SL49_9AGAR|nr:uncharacterized protein MIND_00727300 [Mycena indigotica]KAF7301618.1 hypothetical protein MIND_00727300 [Mycena indigotica]